MTIYTEVNVGMVGSSFHNSGGRSHTFPFIFTSCDTVTSHEHMASNVFTFIDVVSGQSREQKSVPREPRASTHTPGSTETIGRYTILFLYTEKNG